MERLSEFLRKEINGTREFLGLDFGKLDNSDPMQTKSFTRGKQAAFCIAHDRVVILENAHDELVNKINLAKRIALDALDKYAWDELKDTDFKSIVGHLYEVLDYKKVTDSTPIKQ